MASPVLAHRIDKQLKYAAKVLEIEIELTINHNNIGVTFHDPEGMSSYSPQVQQSGSTDLGAIRDIHRIYRRVLRDEICAKQGTAELEALLKRPPTYGKHTLAAICFCTSALICPLAFGGSFADLWVSGLFAVALAYMKSAQIMALFDGALELFAALLISFVSRGLSSIPFSPFCYTAISSAAIISILPGYLVVGSFMEVASRQANTGSPKITHALVYTLLLSYSLQYGSEIFLLLAPHARTLIKDDSSPDMVACCYRPPSLPWYQQPFPWWTAFLIVPLFSLGVSLANQQPWRKPALPAMVFISCASYAANHAAAHFIVGRSDVSSALGASVCAVLGLAYSRWTRGTAFQVMVTGVLLMVPSGLAQAGGITAADNGFAIAKSMITVAVTITLGLLLTQALVYCIGKKKKSGAVFSF